MTWLSLETMELKRIDKIAILTLTREDNLNAMSPTFFDNIKQVITELSANDHGIRALIITGNGGGFSVGADLKSFSFEGDFDLGQALRDNFEPMVLDIKALPFPTIAAVNGYCVGAGMGLMLACDLTIAARCATFAQGFVGIALIPDAGSTYFLPRLIGRARATEMMMLGENVTASDAFDIGMINKVVDDHDLMTEAMTLATKLAAGPTSAIVQIRKLLDASQESTLIDQLGLEADEQKIAGQSSNFREGVSAFLQKRDPNFK